MYGVSNVLWVVKLLLEGMERSGAKWIDSDVQRTANELTPTDEYPQRLRQQYQILLQLDRHVISKLCGGDDI